MGKRLDRISLWLILSALIAVWFLYAGLSPVWAIALGASGAVSIFSVCRYIKKHRPPRKTPTKRQKRATADAFLRRLPMMPNEQALTYAYDALKTRYPLTEHAYQNEFLYARHGEKPVAIAMIQKMRVSPDDVLTLWKRAAQTPDKTLIALIPGKSEPEIRLLADRFSKPEAVLIDRNQLKALFTKIECPAPDEKPRPRRRSVIWALQNYIARGRTGKYLLYALPLTAYYLITGKWAYLLAAAGLLLIAGLGLQKARAPESLL